MVCVTVETAKIQADVTTTRENGSVEALCRPIHLTVLSLDDLNPWDILQI